MSAFGGKADIRRRRYKADAAVLSGCPQLEPYGLAILIGPLIILPMPARSTRHRPQPRISKIECRPAVVWSGRALGARDQTNKDHQYLPSVNKVVDNT
jgi:hypothetical protein